MCRFTDSCDSEGHHTTKDAAGTAVTKCTGCGCVLDALR